MHTNPEINILLQRIIHLEDNLADAVESLREIAGDITLPETASVRNARELLGKLLNETN